MITRRHAVSLSAKGVAALLASVPHLPGCARHRVAAGAAVAPAQGSVGSHRIDWAGFVQSLSALADAQFSADWDQDQHVKEVMALMRHLDLDDAQFEQIYDGYANAWGQFPEIKSVHRGGHFSVATLEFDAGDEIRLHNHPDMTGVILCVSGAVEVEAFNLLPTQSPMGKLLMEQVLQEKLTPGVFATLTAEHGNIHRLVATEYTELLDVFTPPYDKERMTRYRWYERADEPIDGGVVFEAWERA